MKREGMQALLVAALAATAGIGTTVLQNRPLHHKVLAGYNEMIKSMDESRTTLVPATDGEIIVIIEGLSQEKGRGITVDRRTMSVTSGVDDDRDAPKFEWQASRGQIFKALPQTSRMERGPRATTTTYLLMPITPEGKSAGVVSVALGRNVNPLYNEAVSRSVGKDVARGSANSFVWYEDEQLDFASKGETAVPAPSVDSAPEAAFGPWSAWQDTQSTACWPNFWCFVQKDAKFVHQYRTKTRWNGKKVTEWRWKKKHCGC